MYSLKDITENIRKSSSPTLCVVYETVSNFFFIIDENKSSCLSHILQKKTHIFTYIVVTKTVA